MSQGTTDSSVDRRGWSATVAGVDGEAAPVSEPVAAHSQARPNKLAQILAAAIVSTVVAAVMAKILGRKAGFVAFFLTATAHEVLDAPLARLLGERLGQMTE
jgi:hypothetical protein